MKRRILRQSIPKWLKQMARRIYDLPLDATEVLSSRRDALTPPRRLRYGQRLSDFKRLGIEYSRYLVELGNLKPNEKMLDVGCGPGRVAAQLTEYRGREGGYEGFDIVADAINWCRMRITPKHTNFHFQLADIYNQYYNPKGTHTASSYRFPYRDECFDLVALISVFTHMRPVEMETISLRSRACRKQVADVWPRFSC